MQFGLTIPLIKQLQLKNIPYGHETDLLFCWELHYLNINHNDILIAVNGNNRFSIILFGLHTLDWKRYPSLVKEAISKALSEMGYDELAIASYFKLADAVEITKTHGRRPVAYLNKMVETLYQYRYDLDSNEMYQSSLMHIVNHTTCHATGFKEHGLASEFLIADLCRLGITK